MTFTIFSLITLILLNCNPTLSKTNYINIIKEIMEHTVDLNFVNNYSVEKHIVQTDDGYNLYLQRIPYGRNRSISEENIPVLIMHSLFCNSMSWIDNLEDSPGFILADEGFDVWLGNVRGNKGTWHTIYGRNEPEFWDFSWETMAEHDLPAIIDYIIQKTKRKKILYIGLSQGSLIGFALFSSKPEFKDKVAGFVALGPVLSVRYTNSIAMNVFLNNKQMFYDIFTRFQISEIEFLPHSIKHIALIISIFAGRKTSYVFSAFGGYNNLEFYNMTRLPIYARDGLESTSVKNARHYEQLHSSNKFSKFDYGKAGNLDRYDKITPPEYDTNNIDIPIALFSTANDPLATPIDVQVTARKLKNILVHEIISEPMFNHMNFMWVHPSKSILYDKVISILRQMWDGVK